ncbi:hypothetical protein F5051DRAFT_447779 [Lentinula edodes]|nr:hypothetical protein F5051DRAFT_447779 [Lentinula edodes]
MFHLACKVYRMGAGICSNGHLKTNFDDEHYSRWQGETSGLTLLNLLIECKATESATVTGIPSGASPTAVTHSLWRIDVDPRTLWRTITSVPPRSHGQSCSMLHFYIVLHFAGPSRP